MRRFHACAGLSLLAVGFLCGCSRQARLTSQIARADTVIVLQRWHGHGLGTELLKALVCIGREENLDRIIGLILPENHAMQRVSKKAGFTLNYDPEGGQWQAVIPLRGNTT